MTGPGAIEPTATDQKLWNRKAAERINHLLRVIADLERRMTAVETP